MRTKTKCIALLTAAALLCTGSVTAGTVRTMKASAADSLESAYNWDAVRIGGGGFVSGIITGKKDMYARTDVGGAYKYNFDTEEWEQLFAFLNEEDRGLLSVDSMAIDPTDDNTVYFLCGCAYFSGARTVIFKTTDGGKTFTQTDVTDLIQVHGNGDGRQCGEAIAIDPDNPDVLYCGGDVASGSSALIMSEDGGKTWSPVKGYDDLGYYKYTVNWPFWDNHPVRAATHGDENAYNTQNGVSTIAITNGKVYVGTSVNDESFNMVVADVGSDDFTELSKSLPSNSYPSRINFDADGNLLICYVGGLSFNGTGGGIYKYDIQSGTVTDISPSENSFGACVSDPKDSSALLATTCGVWSGQQWDAETTCYGEYMYRSTDGGATWTAIYPGKMDGNWVWDEESGEMHQNLLYDYLNTGGFDWIYGKAIHWSGALVLNPADTSKVMVTSGNGVFEWTDVWTDDVAATFHPNGIEEVVALDMISIPGGSVYSAIGDYDGFEHTDPTVSGKQHTPNMGSTSAIAYCPQNPDVMIRIAERQNDIAPGFYTTDGGKTWTPMANSPGGKAAITQLADGSYRFFQSGSDDGAVKYSDDMGQTWNSIGDIQTVYGSKTTYLLVEPDQPNVVYAYATYYNSSWGYSKPQAEFSDAHYTLYVSTDYGKSFTATDIAMYDQCDSAGRIAYLGEDDLILAAGWYGLYRVTGSGKNVEQLDVYYCKTVGYGAPEKAGDVNTLYMYGKPSESDPEGIYRSQDGGKTWLLINQNKLYGGTGNGNFLVGDMNEFGKVYMSTVGCGIVYGELVNSDDPKPVTTTTPKETTTTKATTTVSSLSETPAASTTENTTASDAESTTTTITPLATTATSGNGTETTTTAKPNPGNILYGDVNLDAKIDLTDAILLNKACASAVQLNDQQINNADCDDSGEITPNDSIALLRFLVHLLDSLPETE